MAGHCSSDRIFRVRSHFWLRARGWCETPSARSFALASPYRTFSVGANYGAEGAMGAEERL